MPSIVRSSLFVVTAFAVTGLPQLPVEHIHRAGIEGRTTALVHAHSSDGADIDQVPATPRGHTSFRVGHGNHDLAIFLSTDYTSVLRVVPQPVAWVNLGAIVSPTFELLGSVHAHPVHWIHGPPGSVWLTRGPPSLS
jgi:hypothetical protein